MISIKLQSNFIEITVQHRCFPVILLHVFRRPFTKNISGGMLLTLQVTAFVSHTQVKTYKLKYSTTSNLDSSCMLGISSHLPKQTLSASNFLVHIEALVLFLLLCKTILLKELLCICRKTL